MYFHKVDAPSNFRFHGAPKPVVERLGPGAFRLRAPDARWPAGSLSNASLDHGALSGMPGDASLAMDGGVIRLSVGGRDVLRSSPDRGLGVNGKKWILCFDHDEGATFYGMGEKNLGFDRSGKRTLFWNTDAFADFHWGAIGKAEYDPAYASIPVLIVRKAGLWAAIVVDNPWPVFMNTGADEGIFQAGATPFRKELFVGARDGEPDIVLIASSDPVQVVRSIQALQGRTPLPPLWALGHHQCRWGYASTEDLARVADGYDKRGIPTDGLWLDIDYMEGCRVFTVKKAQEETISKGIQALRERGYRVVPILDPGIRRDPSYPVYQRARTADVLCRTPEGGEFVGYVWPGYTVFPDFSLPEGRAFWAKEVEAFTRLGFSGYWIDMNDPSTGTVPVEDMLFSRGSLPHEAWHNQYALGMAMATRAGLEAARPRMRQFVISRSGFLGMARWSALWNGDNVSNDEHLAASIPVSLNLSVSGLPFNGPDLPGFAGDADDRLAAAWYKAGFLFPFFRNHSVAGSREQEPWRFGKAAERTITGFIRSRYRLMPTLYNLFMDQEESGDPIIRPLWYHDPSEAAATVGDQFFVGKDLMQAPMVHRSWKKRSLWLPSGRWYGLVEGRFLEGGRRMEVGQGEASTPLYLRSPSILPLRRGEIRRAACDLSSIDLLVVIEEGQRVQGRYRFDDGESLAYREGQRSEYRFDARMDGGRISLTVEPVSTASGELSLRPLVLSAKAPKSIEIRGPLFDGTAKKPAREILDLAGSRLRVHCHG